jgi:hypothetical protein
MDSWSLSTPEQHHYNDPTVERDVERLREWLTNLPLMDVAKTVRLVQGALDSLNQQQLEPETRYPLLEVFRHTVERLYVTVDPLYIRQLNLGKSQRENVTSSIEQLLLAMAGGYKIIIRALYEPAVRQPPPGLFGLAISRAMDQLGYALLDSYRYYRSVPEALFAELHQLYRYARYFGLLAVTAADQGAGQSPGIADSYHAILLLSLTDPSRLAEGEVGLLYGILRQHAGKCCITQGSHWSGDPGGLYQIDLGSDAPPWPCSRPGQQAAAREPYLLDARETLRAIREQLELTPAKVRRQSPEAVLLRLLQPDDAMARQNREPRHPDSRGTRLVAGLNAIHGFLREALRAGRKVVEDTGVDAAVRPSPCRIVDTSNNGLRLVWEEGRAGDVRVGDLLGIVEDGHRLRLAIARSVQIHREAGMELGVQKLHGSGGPVYCRTPADDEAEEICALFMPASEVEGVAATLIMAKGFYEAGRRLLINSSGREVRARAGRNVSDSPEFDRFEFAADDWEK